MLGFKNINEEIRNGRNVMITSLGRVYINPNTVSNYTYEQNQLNYMDMNNGTYRIEIKQAFPNYGVKYGDLTYVYQNRILDMRGVEAYLRISNEFLHYLIKNKPECSFEQSVEYFFNLYTLKLCQSDIRSLLKPVYIRYLQMKKNSFGLEKVKNGLGNIHSIEKVILYDVPVILNNSRLRILENFYIDISEDIIFGREIIKFNCISMGGIRKFDKVEIKIENYEIVSITFSGKGYQ